MTIETCPEGMTNGLSRDISDFNVEGLDTTTDIAAGRRRTLNPSAMRELIPVSGLREYWYPAIVDHKVGTRRPTKIKLLDTDIVLFRNKKGEVVASSNVCPHRGGSMGDGHCHYSGTISCPYHGWTFDETGDCLAVLGEGPDSPIPGNEGARLKMYPTITLKGCVFIWMGEREPSAPEEDIPPEFFQENSQIQYSVSNWACNWRQAIENINDAHAFYVHKDSLQLARTSEAQLVGWKIGPTRPRPQVVNGRGISFPSQRSRTKGQPSAGARPADTPFREPYSGLGGQLFPKHEFFRVHWAKLMTKSVPYRLKTSIDPNWKSDEWCAFHLPSMFRTFAQGNYVYTRNCVPVSESQSRMFYFYTTYGRSGSERLVNKLWFTFASNWFKNYNFSGQDQAVMEPQYYDQPEALSATDVYPLGIRRLIIERARDFQEVKPND